MENEPEVSAKEVEGQFGGFECPYCGVPATLDGKGWVSSTRVDEFLPFIDHLIYHFLPPAPQPPWGVEESFWRWQEALRRNPSTPPHLVEPLPDYYSNPLAWAEATGGKRPIILPEQRAFLPAIANWITHALKSLPELDSIRESSLLVANRVVELVRMLREEFQGQRRYLLQHEQALRNTAMDPKWLRKRGNQARFVGDCMAGVSWGLAPTSSREFTRLERLRPELPILKNFRERLKSIGSSTLDAGKDSSDVEELIEEAALNEMEGSDCEESLED